MTSAQEKIEDVTDKKAEEEEESSSSDDEHEHGHEGHDHEHGHEGHDHAQKGGDKKANKGEKKFKKAMSKFGMKPVTGINRVTIKKSKAVSFTIARHFVLISFNSSSYTSMTQKS